MQTVAQRQIDVLRRPEHAFANATKSAAAQTSRFAPGLARVAAVLQCRALAVREPFADDPAMVRFHLPEAEQHARQAQFMEQSMIEAVQAELADSTSGRELIAAAQG